ncbi:MAG: type II secretion system protein GspJ [Bdellovibrionales bacterium]
MNRRGFTLIEIIIAMLIMTFLSLFTVQAIRRAFRTKEKVQRDIDKNSTVRDALRIIERDINMAFNYRDPYIELYNEAQKVRKKLAEEQAKKPNPNPNPGTTNPPPTPTTNPDAGQLDPNQYKQKTEKLFTQFIGEKDRLDFTSLSNIRMMEDSKISTQAEIGYHIKSCRRRATQEQSSKCLWRRVSNYIHEDITKEGEETVLLENVTEFSLRYLGPGKDGEWVDSWSSGEGGDDVTKNKFPYAVEITLEVKDSDPKAKDKSLRMTIVASIRNPNNPKPKDPQQGVDGAAPVTQ